MRSSDREGRPTHFPDATARRSRIMPLYHSNVAVAGALNGLCRLIAGKATGEQGDAHHERRFHLLHDLFSRVDSGLNESVFHKQNCSSSLLENSIEILDNAFEDLIH